MPLYTYECEACKIIFETRHSIKERLEKCESCGAEALNRIPSIPFIAKKINHGDAKAGDVVKKSIEEAREELKQERDRLKQKESE